ncbi:MAG: hypothetical protein R3B70_10305 [Polyangiaceae bacterium]
MSLLALIALFFGSSCELVLGDLPPSQEDLATSGTTPTTGGQAGTGGQGAQAGVAGSTGATAGAGGEAGSTTAGGTGGTAGTGGATTTTQSCCDCDGDTQLAEGLCGGTDCDDNDKKVYEGNTVYHTDESPTQGFDWDCSGSADPDPDLNKKVDCGVIGLPCGNAGTGYLGAIPACGDPGEWGTCTGTILPCTKQVIEANKKMACK